MNSVRYNPKEIEPRWQKFWEDEATFKMPNPGDPNFDASKPKYYVLDMFPYPSGSGLHVGHPEGYTATDILARWRRMTGHNVLHPMGWDAFGLPAEQYAMQTGTHPAVTTQKNINSFRDTLKRLGFSYDWSREVDTTEPNYYRWTQWIFLKLFNSIFDSKQQKARDVKEVAADLSAGKIGLKDGTIVFDLSIPNAVSGRQWNALSADEQWRVLANHRLAFVSEAPVWWCEQLGTVLANEEVIDGRSERGDFPCVKKPLRQWMLRITAYAERLLDDLEGLDWPEPIKAMQRHWIGRSEGAEVDFEVAPSAQSKIQNPKSKIRVFTTRPDTLYGATYMVLAPEHPLVKEIATEEQKAAVNQYILDASRKSDLARTDLAKDKSGVFTGAYAFNPVYEDRADPRAKIPIWIADYVLMGYGTGAIMAVPGHDERDWEFAVKFKLPIVPVVMPPDAWLKENARISANGKGFIESAISSKVIAVLHHLAKTNSAAGEVLASLQESENQFKKMLSEGDAYVQLLRELFRAAPDSFKSTFVDDGVAFNSPAMEGLPTPEAKRKITEWLREKKLGERKITYRLRDWLFSRQRYWGEPFPIVWDEKGMARALCDSCLPLKLPQMDNFKPTGSTEPPLSKAKDWLKVAGEILPDGSVRETAAPAIKRQRKTGSFDIYSRYVPEGKSAQRAFHFVSWKVSEGQKELTPAERTAVTTVLKQNDAKQYGLIAYVVMPDQVHAIVYPFQNQTVGTIVEAWRANSAAQLRKDPLRAGVWDAADDRLIGDGIEFFDRTNYIQSMPFARWPDLADYEWLGFPASDRMPAKKGTQLLPAVQMPDKTPLPPLPMQAAKIAVSTPGGPVFTRETNTMPQWAGSCWYYLRYLDAHNRTAAVGKDAENYWMNVDLYVGGAEHAVLHLLYSRFWHKVLFDHGVVHHKEPYQKLFNQGLIQAFVYEDPTGRLVPNDDIDEKPDGSFVQKSTGLKLEQAIGKMSKSLKNVIPADDVIEEYGADTLRLYEMFMGPLEGSKPWSPRDVPGMFRFLRDCWRMIVEDDDRQPNAGNLRTQLLPSASELIGADNSLERDLHKTIKGVTVDLERMAFNTAISKLMVFKNKALEDISKLNRSQAERFLLMLAPFAPHLAEELWARMRHGKSLAYEAWPKFEEALTQDATKELAVQVNGKIKSRITVAATASDDQVKAEAQKTVAAELAGKTVVKVVVVPGRLVNIVVK